LFFARHGNSERVYRLEFVSNQPFTDNEFIKWRETMVIGGLQLPSLGEVEQKVAAIKQASAYSFKDSDIDKVDDV
jgi:RNA polymerase-associated protein RTF1